MSEQTVLKIVLDTSVLVAAVRSRNGASFALISMIPDEKFVPCLSVGLYAEWQEVLTRPENIPAGLSVDDTLRFLRYLASQSYLHQIHFRWRPFLPDADDDMLLELAFASGCAHIITHNVKHFVGTEHLGVTALSPGEFLKIVRKQT